MKKIFTPFLFSIFILMQIKAKAVTISNENFSFTSTNYAKKNFITKDLNGNMYTVDINGKEKTELNEVGNIRFLNIDTDYFFDLDFVDLEDNQKFKNLKEVHLYKRKSGNVNLFNLTKLKKLNTFQFIYNYINLFGTTYLTSSTELGYKSNQFTTLDVSKPINLKISDASYYKTSSLYLFNNKKSEGLEFIENVRVSKELDNVNIFWRNPDIEYTLEHKIAKARIIEHKINPAITSDNKNVDQTINIQDPKFLAYLLQSSSNSSIALDLNGKPCYIDTNKNGIIEVSEAENISSLYIKNSNDISSVKGIQAFKNLKKLEISYTNIHNIDLSQLIKLEQLSCYNNQLDALDISNLINLKFLNVSSNSLTTLDISKNIKLSKVIFNDNNIQTLYMKSGKSYNLDFFWGYNNPLIYVCCNVSDKKFVENYIVSEFRPKPIISFDCEETPTINITDPKFLNYLLQSSTSNSIAKDINGRNCAIDTNGNGKIEISEAVNIGYLNLIYDYKGLFKFDSSKDINQFVNLKELTIATPGTSGILDIYSLKKLEKIKSITSPETISKLELSKCKNLKEILIPDQSLTSFDAHGLENLEKLDLSNNKLTTIILNNSSILVTPYSALNKLTYLNVSGNQLSDLDIYMCPNLLELKCNNNKLESLLLYHSKNLTDINCENNLINILSVINHKYLKTLNVANNSISSLDISKNTILEYINFTNNNLKTLYIKNGNTKNWNWDNLNLFMGNPNLEYICCDTFDQEMLKAKAIKYKINPVITSDCDYGEPIVNIPDKNFLEYLKSISTERYYSFAKDLKGNICTVDINHNGKIEVSEAENIKSLYIKYGDISSLEGIKSFKNLETISFGNCTIKNVDLSNLLKLKFLFSHEANIDTLNLSGCSNLIYLNVFRSNLSSLQLSGCINLNEIELEENNLSSLDVSNFINLEILNAPRNNLTSLNLSNCNSLKYLDVLSNQLTSLNLLACSGLQELICDENQIKSLNVNHLKNLTMLSCEENLLTSLDLRNLINLKFLVACNNKITSLDLSKNLNLQGIIMNGNALETIYLKTGKPKSWDWDNVSFLTNNPIKYICCDAFDKEAIEDIIKELKYYPYPLLETDPIVTSDCDIEPEEPTKPIEEEPAKPIEEEPAKPIEEEPAKPIEEEPAKPIEEEPAKPIEEEPAKPIEEEPAWPTEVETYDSMFVSPNPARDKIQFSEQVKTVEIYSLNGRLAISTTINSNEMNISHLQPGLYILKIKTNRGTYIRKLSKL